MADERTPGEPEPEDRDPGSGSDGYQLGGGAGSGKGAGGSGSGGSGGPAGFGAGGPGGNPFEAFMNQFGGGDMNQLMAQLQNAFSMLGGGGSLFGQPTTGTDSGVNWEVTKDTARKTVASLGADPSPGFGQQHDITEAVSIAETWLDAATAFPGSAPWWPPGAGRSGSRTRCPSGSGWWSRWPPTSPMRWRVR